MAINGIGNVTDARADISEMLSKIREVSNKTKVFSEGNTVSATKNFSDVLSLTKNAFSHVNELQNSSDQIKNAYITGDPNVSISQVVVAAQKSKLAFEGLLTVRNKILEAYKEIMNMAV